MSKVQAHSYDLGPRFSELVLHELDPRYSREEVTLAATSGELPFGMVLARCLCRAGPTSISVRMNAVCGVHE